MASFVPLSLIVNLPWHHSSEVCAGIEMWCVEVYVPIMPRASHTPEVVAAAVRHALICTPASAPANRSAFCTPFSAFTAAVPFTSRLYAGDVVFTPSELYVNR